MQIGVCQESFGESIQRNMSWAGRDRPLPPEMIPHRLFDRLFGRKEEYWIERKKSILDAVSGEATTLEERLGNDEPAAPRRIPDLGPEPGAVDASLPPEYSQVVEQPPEGGDLTDWPRIAKLQSDLLVHALASRQTRVASYMLTKCQGLSRFPWLGYTYQRHHEYTHGGVETPEGQRILRDICRWHVEEFAYLLAKLKATPEGDGNIARPHLRAVRSRTRRSQSAQEHQFGDDRAGHAGQPQNRPAHTRGRHCWRSVPHAGGRGGRARIGKFPTADKKLTAIV